MGLMFERVIDAASPAVALAAALVAAATRSSPTTKRKRRWLAIVK